MPIAVAIRSATTQRANPPRVPAPAPPSLPDVVPERMRDNVLASHATVLNAGDGGPTDQQEDIAFKAQYTDELGTTTPEHMRGVYRFADSESQSDVLDAIENGVVIDAEYYGLWSHACTHDPDTGVGQGHCPDWTLERSHGTIPPEVTL